MLDTLFPFSYIGISLGFLFGVGIAAVSFGFLSAGLIILCIFIGMVRIMPLVNVCKRVLHTILPNYEGKAENNIRESFKIKNPEALQEERSIYMWHPHGVFCSSQFFHIGTNFTNWPTLAKARGTALEYLLWLPFMKEVFEELKAVPSDYVSMKKCLEEGVSLSVAPGGMREMLHRDSAILSKRRGIFRMALETGTPLVPIISIKEDSLCQIIEMPDYIQKSLEKYDICICFPTLKSIYKLLSLLTTPLKEPIYSVVGSPIQVEQKEIPSDTDIEDLKKRYIIALKDLYKKETLKELNIL